MTNPRFLLLLTSMFLIYTQGLWERIAGFSPTTMLILESAVWLYLLLSIKYLRKETPGNILFIVYLCFSLLTSILNGSGTLAWIKYIRYFVYFYLIFITLYHTHISHKQWDLLFKLAVFLILIQGLGAAYTTFILNLRIEGYVGLMSSLGGSTASIFPLMVISLSILVYLFNTQQNSKLNLILLGFVISASLVGYSSGKRAIFFTIPLFLIIAVILSIHHFVKRPSFYRRLVILIFIISLISPFYFLGIKTTKGINYLISGNETNIELLQNAFEYAVDYGGSVSYKGLNTGRAGSTAQIVSQSTKNLNLFVFGKGYGSIKEESTTSSLGVLYGIVGFTRDIISGGWIVMLLTVLILVKVILTNRSLESKFTKALRLLILFIFLVTHFGYSSDFTVTLKINFLLAILYALINSPVHALCLESILLKYFSKFENVEDPPHTICNGSPVIF